MDSFKSAKSTIIFLWLVLGVAAGMLVTGGVLFAAQEGFDEVWSAPVNISRSGAATAPQMLAVAGENLVFWRDTIDGFYFTRGQGQSWSEPATGEFPFATRRYSPDLQPDSPTPLYTPELIADEEGVIHAFWQGEEGTLFYSNVPAADFGTFAAWAARQQLGEAAVKTALAIGGDGRLHLAYFRPVQSAEAPAGLYYRQSSDGGASWSTPELLAASAYVRVLSPQEANLEMGTGGLINVYIAWEDRAREQIRFIRSVDGGQTWREAETIDRRQATDSSSAVGPQAVRMTTAGEAVHLVWQAGHEGITCGLYHQWSADGGESWEPREQILEELEVCGGLAETPAGAGENARAPVTLFTGAETPMVLASTGSGAYLSAWNGITWSAPERQTPLAGFTDQETFRQVNFNCGQSLVTERSTLGVVGCSGGGEGAAGDLWYVQRPLAPLVESLTVTPVWSTPAAVSEAPVAGEGPAAIAAPVLLADGQGRFHAFWSQADAGAATPLGVVPDSIYYARFDQGRWSRPVAVIEGDGGQALDPAAALLPNGRLLLVWSGGGNGAIHFSWAAADRASVASEWVEPQQVPGPDTAGSAPAIAVEGQSGVIFVAYAIPLNEARGIYLTASTDGGESWGEAQQIFDGAAAGWERVDNPQLALTGLDQAHLLWRQRTLPGNAEAAALYYARSGDGGTTWSEPELVENGTPQAGPVVWSELVSVGTRELHRLWQEWDGARLNLWHQFSQDNGANWSRAARVGGFGDAGGPVAVVQDAAERIYLLQVAGLQVAGLEGVGDLAVQQWLWVADEERWVEGEGLALRRGSGAKGLAAAIAPGGELAVIVAGEDETVGPRVYFAGRSLALPDVLPTPLPTLTPTPLPTATPSPTPRPQPTATPVFGTAPDQGGINLPDILPFAGGDLLLLGGLLALVPALLIVLGVVVVYARTRPR